MAESTTDAVFGVLFATGFGIVTGGLFAGTTFLLAHDMLGFGFVYASFAGVLVAGALAVVVPCMALTLAVYREKPDLEADLA